jgi:hypothetical protein
MGKELRILTTRALRVILHRRRQRDRHAQPHHRRRAGRVHWESRVLVVCKELGYGSGCGVMAGLDRHLDRLPASLTETLIFSMQAIKGPSAQAPRSDVIGKKRETKLHSELKFLPQFHVAASSTFTLVYSYPSFQLPPQSFATGAARLFRLAVESCNRKAISIPPDPSSSSNETTSRSISSLQLCPSS